MYGMCSLNGPGDRKKTSIDATDQFIPRYLLVLSSPVTLVAYKCSLSAIIIMMRLKLLFSNPQMKWDDKTNNKCYFSHSYKHNNMTTDWWGFSDDELSCHYTEIYWMLFHKPSAVYANKCITSDTLLSSPKPLVVSDQWLYLA